MSQRDSGYERKERDCYETPEWVTEALMPHIPRGAVEVWEPACGSGKMARVLDRHFQRVVATDIINGPEYDFLKTPKGKLYPSIITNPPYELATEFVETAIALTCAKGWAAMLLRTDFDHAKTRSRLFGSSPRFAKKLVLTKRIRWFEDSTGSPSFNHAWFIWDWQHVGAPTLAYH